MKKPELLAPAGNIEKLKVALIYGADAVFIGGKQFSLRARASNFEIDDIKEACDFAHNLGKKVYVTTNIVPHNEDMDGLIDYLKALENSSVDAIIATSPYVIETAKKHTNLEIHLSTQQSVTNYQAVKFWNRLGVTRIVLARELSKLEISEIIKNTDSEIEVFIHGGMCVSYSGRCTLSNNMTDRDANRGGCAHSCRWNYDIYENNKILNKDISFSMSSKDLQTVRHIPDLIDFGVSSLKIEGRMKSLYYIATVVSVYRKLIDEYTQKKDIDLDKYIKEIKKAENRLTSHGFMEGMTTPNEQLYNMRSEVPTKEFVGIIVDYDDLTKIATVEQRNYFLPGDTLEAFGPIMETTKFKVIEIKDEKDTILDAARHPKQILKIPIPFKVNKYDMLRKVR